MDAYLIISITLAVGALSAFAGHAVGYGRGIRARIRRVGNPE